MIVFPNCKINLGLHILRKRTDGYHDLETVFYPVPLKDALEVLPAASENAHHLTLSGNALDTKSDENICIKAYQLLKKDFTAIPPVQMHLHKVIPSGAGLGGGSADGAFTLMMLNKLFRLNIPEKELMGYALQLGSDCPFFIRNKPSYATGRGEHMVDISLDLSDYTIILVNPGIHVPTAMAFSGIHPKEFRTSVKEIIQQPVGKWKQLLINDFESVIFQLYPEIKEIKEKLYDQGAVYAAMSGSGSTVFGIFKKDQNPELKFPSHYFLKAV